MIKINLFFPEARNDKEFYEMFLEENSRNPHYQYDGLELIHIVMTDIHDNLGKPDELLQRKLFVLCKLYASAGFSRVMYDKMTQEKKIVDDRKKYHTDYVALGRHIEGLRIENADLKREIADMKSSQEVVLAMGGYAFSDKEKAEDVIARSVRMIDRVDIMEKNEKDQL